MCDEIKTRVKFNQTIERNIDSKLFTSTGTITAKSKIRAKT